MALVALNYRPVEEIGPSKFLETVDRVSRLREEYAMQFVESVDHLRKYHQDRTKTVDEQTFEFKCSFKKMGVSFVNDRRTNHIVVSNVHRHSLADKAGVRVEVRRGRHYMI
jgi:hypothetical protein